MEFLKVPKLSVTRRKFFGATALLLGGVVALRKKLFVKTVAPKTTKMLTRDGKLVEVDLKQIPQHKKSISNNELASWVWKQQKL